MELHMLSEDELALMEAIRNKGSLSRAAAALGKPPSTVSHAARQLESRFDALLFDRRGYRLELTPAGVLLVEEAARLQVDASRVHERVRQVAGGWDQRLVIVTDEIIDFETLSPMVAAFDEAYPSTSLRLTAEVLGGTWEALREGRADLVIGATNEPPQIADLQWFELGVIDWVFAVGARSPLAAASAPLTRKQIAGERGVVVADSARRAGSRTYGTVGGQSALAVPTMRAKIIAQRDGLGVGWLPRQRISSLLANGSLIEKQTSSPREPNTLYIAWCVERPGPALAWWIERLRQPRVGANMLSGIDMWA
jgi:DNA-binding transcriptional LysR family regulator